MGGAGRQAGVVQRPAGAAERNAGARSVQGDDAEGGAGGEIVGDGLEAEDPAAAAGFVLMAMVLSMNAVAIYLRYKMRKNIKW